jgi:ribonuclease HI
MVLGIKKEQVLVVSSLFHMENKMMLACYLEFDCTNNIAEYKALLQGLKKTLDL